MATTGNTNTKLTTSAACTVQELAKIATNPRLTEEDREHVCQVIADICERYGLVVPEVPVCGVTLEYVKEQLPDVLVEYQGGVFTGKVTGEDTDYATVTIAPDGDYGYGYVTAEFSWEAVTRMINTGSPLVM